MDKAWKLFLAVVFINLVIFIVGVIIYESFLANTLGPAAEKLAPYGVEILHLR